MWIKICGMTDPAAVAAALDAGVDAIGLVFYASSVRCLAPAEAAALAAPARGRCAVIAVTLHPSQSLVDEILHSVRPDVLQSDWSDLMTLRLPLTLGRLPVVRAASAAHGELPGRVLFEGSTSGSGRTADWAEAVGLAQRTELILAGGLSVHNVAQAIRSVRPYGVDVSSGVEASPGRKPPAMIAQFVQAARAAAREAA